MLRKEKTTKMKRGWFGDSWKHSLAARGYRLARKPQKVSGFDSFNSVIVAHLRSARRPMTSNELAGRSGMAWETVKKELLMLESQGKVQKVQSGERVYWRLV